MSAYTLYNDIQEIACNRRAIIENILKLSNREAEHVNLFENQTKSLCLVEDLISLGTLSQTPYITTQILNKKQDIPVILTIDYTGSEFDVGIVDLVNKFVHSPLSISDLGWSIEKALNARMRLLSFEEDWDAPGMELYDRL